MRHTILYAIAFLLTFPPVASADLPSLMITESGYYYIIIDASGVPSLVPVSTVVDLSGRIAPIPPVKPTPPLDSSADLVKQWSMLVGDFDNSQALALVYEQMANGLKSGSISPADVWDATRVMTNTVLKSSGGEASWTVFRDKLSKLIAELTAKGTLTTPEQVAQFFESVVSGLRSSVPAEAPELSLSEGLQIIEFCQKTIDKAKGA